MRLAMMPSLIGKIPMKPCWRVITTKCYCVLVSRHSVQCRQWCMPLRFILVNIATCWYFSVTFCVGCLYLLVRLFSFMPVFLSLPPHGQRFVRARSIWMCLLALLWLSPSLPVYMPPLLGKGRHTMTPSVCLFSFCWQDAISNIMPV